MSRELQTINQQNKLALWAGRIRECRNSGHNVKDWCKENGICEQTYYRWQRKIFENAKAQHEVQFVEVTPVKPVCSRSVAVPCIQKKTSGNQIGYRKCRKFLYYFTVHLTGSSSVSSKRK